MTTFLKYSSHCALQNVITECKNNSETIQKRILNSNALKIQINFTIGNYIAYPALSDTSNFLRTPLGLIVHTLLHCL